MTPNNFLDAIIIGVILGLFFLAMGELIVLLILDKPTRIVMAISYLVVAIITAIVYYLVLI